MNKIKNQETPAKKSAKRKSAPRKNVKRENQYTGPANRTSDGIKKKKPEKYNQSLAPLLIILIALLALTSFMAFSEKSSFLSNLLSRSTDKTPLIERPEIIQNEIVKDDNLDNSYSVTNEVEIKIEHEKPEEKTALSEPEKSMKSRLFYVKVSDEGQISLKSVIRPINYISTPLTETMKSLIIGPDRSDLNKGLLNLIPKDTFILSIKISQAVAYIDFNESFRYNSLGIEGYTAQLMQIVYTATEFQSVEKVQILIDGKKYDYLGAEGVYIGEPIDREYFNTF